MENNFCTLDEFDINTEINYDILNPIDRADWREHMSKVVYTVVPKEFIMELKDLKDKNLAISGKAYEQTGIFGTGAYFFIDNLDYAKYLANKEHKYVMEVMIETTNSLNLLSGNAGQQQLKKVLTSPLIKIQNNPIDTLIKESETKYDSVIGIMVDGENLLDSLVYDYMTMIICIKDYSCIKGYGKIIK